MKFNLLKWLPVILFGISLSTDAATIADPYGICAHISHYEKKSQRSNLNVCEKLILDGFAPILPGRGWKNNAISGISTISTVC